jgi:multimeric flavodoxin WrbA
MDPKRLLIIAHAPSDNTRRLRDAALAGASAPEIENVKTRLLSPFDASPDDVRMANAILLGTTENLGYMSGALKDFFDRIYYPCLEHTRGLPYSLYIRAGHDGTGTLRGIRSIVTGLAWREVQGPLVFKGAWDDSFVGECRDLGAAMAAGLEAGIF